MSKFEFDKMICQCNKCLYTDDVHGIYIDPMMGKWDINGCKLTSFYSIDGDITHDNEYIVLNKNNKKIKTPPIYYFFSGILDQSDAIKMLEKEYKEDDIDLFKNYLKEYYNLLINYDKFYEKVIELFPIKYVFKDIFLM